MLMHNFLFSMFYVLKAAQQCVAFFVFTSIFDNIFMEMSRKTRYLEAIECNSHLGIQGIKNRH